MKANFTYITFGLLLICGVNTTIAKDLFVAPSGSDGVTYESNNINNPWATVAKAFTSIQPGDTVYFRGGNYSISSQINTKDNINPSSAAERVLFSNFNGETVTFNASIGRTIMIDRDYYEVDGIHFTAPGTFWYIGKSNSATHFKITNSVGTMTAFGGSENYGCVRFQATRANKGYVENCTFNGPGSDGNKNTAGVFIFRSQGIKIMRSSFFDFPRAVYYKHTCIPADTGIEFAYNYFKDNGTGIVNVAQYADIHDNLFVGGGIFMGDDGGLGDDGSNAGSDHNNIHHNTFYECTINLTRSSSNDGSGAQYNKIKNNIFTQSAEIFQYNSEPHHTVMDNNLYAPGTAVINDRENYSLAQWRSYYGQDVNSIAGTPTFIGGSSPTKIADYALTSDSVGYRAASDGKDIGANVSYINGDIVDDGTETTPIEAPSIVQGFQFVTTEQQPVTDLVNECYDYENLHPGWIFCDDFETEAELVAQNRYFEYKNDEGDFIPLAGVGVNNSKAMQVVWQTGEVDAGRLLLGFGRNPSSYMDTGNHSNQDFREIYYRMYLKHEAAWEGNPNKLSRASVISGSDWSQAMIAHLWASNTNDSLAIDPVSCVVDGVVQCSGWNDFANLQWLGKKVGMEPVFSAGQVGQWQCVEAHVKLNDPGQSNGVQEFWIDGVLQARSENLNFTGTYTDYALNYIGFENHWNAGSPREQKRYFDNIVVSTSRIGCN